MPTAGDRIKDYRKDLGWTLDKLSEKTKLSKGFLSDIEGNKRNPSTENVVKIANAMGASLDYLLRGEQANRSIVAKLSKYHRPCLFSRNNGVLRTVKR